jgi:hypothetical protein
MTTKVSWKTNLRFNKWYRYRNGGWGLRLGRGPIGNGATKKWQVYWGKGSRGMSRGTKWLRGWTGVEMKWTKGTESVNSQVEVQVVPVLNYLNTLLWRHIGEWRYSSTVLDLSTRWRWVVSFMHHLLYPWGKSPQYPLDRRLGGSPELVWILWRREKSLALARNRTLAIQSIARRYTNWPILALHRLK